MDRSHSTATVSANAEPLLRSFVQGERGGKLRSQLEALHPEASTVEIEGAIQTACDRFVDKAEGISEPGQVYAWIRICAGRLAGPAFCSDSRYSWPRVPELAVIGVYLLLSVWNWFYNCLREYAANRLVFTAESATDHGSAAPSASRAAAARRNSS